MGWRSVLFLSLVVVWRACALAVEVPATLRVGIYQNEPKIFVDSGGRPAGFHVDVLEQIVAAEGWQIAYIPGSWAQCLERLEQGEIDLMPDVAYSQKRDERFDFNSETVLFNWARLYASTGVAIRDIFDLDRKKVAVVAGDISYAELRSTVDRFGVTCTFVETQSFEQVFKRIDAGEVHVGLISRLFGLEHEHEYAVDRTFMVVCPVRLHFATAKGRYPEVLAAIDKHLADLKADKDSPYYEAMNRWIHSAGRKRIPRWAKYAAASVLGLAMALGLLSLVLRSQVRARTADLSAANEELQRHRDHLEELVEDRTAELAAANKELESFAYSVSHDLRAPLRAIDGFSDALLEDHGADLDETGTDYLRRVRAACERMRRMVEDMLVLSRATKGMLHREDIDLSAMAEEIGVELREAFPGRNVVLRVQPGIHAHADPRFVRVLLQNLLGNAWKFTAQEPAPRVEVGCAQEQSKDVFFVRDNGIGFDMRYSDEMFGAFRRLDNAAQRPGSGIGLATVQRIVHRHGGRIWAEGRPGEGATFYFTI